MVVEAYGQLVAEGYLEARQGARTQVVRRPTQATTVGDVASAGWVNRNLSGLPDPASFPRREWMRHYRAMMMEYPDASFRYPEPQGKSELRGALAGYLGRVRAVHTTPNRSWSAAASRKAWHSYVAHYSDGEYRSSPSRTPVTPFTAG